MVYDAHFSKVAKIGEFFNWKFEGKRITSLHLKISAVKKVPIQRNDMNKSVMEKQFSREEETTKSTLKSGKQPTLP